LAATSFQGIAKGAMKDKAETKKAVSTALAQAKKHLREFESESGMLPPAPAPTIAAPANLREHFFALMNALEKPDLYSALLQHFLSQQMIPSPRGVFKKTFYELETTAFSPDLVTRVRIGGGRPPGRPEKFTEALGVFMKWVEAGHPSFGELYVRLNKGREFSPQQRKRGADRLRQQINLIIHPREKMPK
jgi:hypothetical protein